MSLFRHRLSSVHVRHSETVYASNPLSYKTQQSYQVIVVPHPSLLPVATAYHK
jgi:hypothetical protein